MTCGRSRRIEKGTSGLAPRAGVSIGCATGILPALPGPTVCPAIAFAGGSGCRRGVVGGDYRRPGPVLRRQMDELHEEGGAGQQQPRLLAGGRARASLDWLKRRSHALEERGTERFGRDQWRTGILPRICGTGWAASNGMLFRLAAGSTARPGRNALVPNHPGPCQAESRPAESQHQPPARGDRIRDGSRRGADPRNTAVSAATARLLSRQAKGLGDSIREPESGGPGQGAVQIPTGRVTRRPPSSRPGNVREALYSKLPPGSVSL